MSSTMVEKIAKRTFLKIMIMKELNICVESLGKDIEFENLRSTQMLCVV